MRLTFLIPGLSAPRLSFPLTGFSPKQVPPLDSALIYDGPCVFTVPPGFPNFLTYLGP